MFGRKKNEYVKLDINKAYSDYAHNKDNIIIICLDEDEEFDKRHMSGAECFPARIIDRFKDYYPDKDMDYYLYSNNKYVSERNTKILLKKGYKAYDLGSFIDFHGSESGTNISRKEKRRRRHNS